ncbi:YD repeat protein (fragment) [Paraburkholderia ribeironis]|uniref:YD repeat protein n=1 Tax=Paraburkholderia ribeironis TaxID=1247936 RepID=A0A1N7RK36_9BURK
MSTLDPAATMWRTRLPVRFFFLVLFVLLSWFIAPHAHAATDCESKYINAGAFPADPKCPLQAASADFGGMGGYVCGDPNAIAAYCSGPSGGTTIEPVSPDETGTLDGDGTYGQPGGSGGCGGGDATAGCGSSTSGGDPVRLYTGQFHLVVHDLHVADTIALDLARVYRSSAYDTTGNPMAGAFGIGTTFNYDSYLTVSATDSNNLQQLVQLYLPSGIRVPFTLRVGTSTTWDDLTSPGAFYRASITSSGSTKLLTLRDGRTMQFTMIGGLYRLTRLQDRIGNTVAIARNSTTGVVTSLSGPNGRTLTFTSVVGARGTPLISRVTDALNRQVSYQYDSQDRLTQVTDAGGGVWKYGWDAKSRMVSVMDPPGNRVSRRAIRATRLAVR